MRGLMLTTALFLLTLLGMQTHACELDKMGNGCRISSGQCSCGYGCKAEFRYPNMEECKLAITGGQRNSCYSTTRCMHGGSCLQITSDPGYKCLCEGTGFFGTRCERPCPGPENPHYRGPFPYECVVI
ncbi:PREDICTED: neurogenic locus notch homolog protein 3-like [Ceratosolen solmsi marchali]|uniref:Neurogenic locus notch homolog protein 3-like n=1 Tax=Ceratosolen solmsi marchali TaxID=326594 RepID=A0AAJ7DWM5_9HYME|nr:PREDICTED: neurogenic locus notch homolog protein 3-like [Ceratosolen solmsi marchali]